MQRSLLHSTISKSWSGFRPSPFPRRPSRSRTRKIIVVSPLRTAGRQNSDIAHELAHIMLNHDLSEICRELNGMPFRTCKPNEEEEATAFGGTMLLPRPLLLSAARRRATIDEIASQYDVTVEMARFRYNTTGVAKQSARPR